VDLTGAPEKRPNAAQDPSLLVRFVALCFADHKQNRYVSWFGFPALTAKPAASHSNRRGLQAFGGIEGLHAALVKVFGDATRAPPAFAIVSGPAGFVVEALSESNCKDAAAFGVVDGGGGEFAGWPLRNLVALLSRRFGREEATVICMRDDVLHGFARPNRPVSFAMDVHVQLGALDQVRASGWEANEKGRLGPRSVDLASLTSPAELAAAAAQLNLQLMRWRLLPELELDALAATKCLLIGAGTLGCAVARGLVAWGVRHITFLDSADVSYSNPARQSLFTFEDCGQPKAATAALALAKIAPSTVSSPAHYAGVRMIVPMPGHALATDPEGLEAARHDVAAFDELVRAHDVIYLLTDTREARWLPTLAARAHRKLLVNVALGLDTFLVQRHGIMPDEGANDQTDLGCYFCNDVVAPSDSTQNRTIDQQCTVSRPGLAPVAGALAVELAIAVMHHPLKARAPADIAATVHHRVVDLDHPLGLLPHSIRGFLTHYTTILPCTAAFPHCTACSKNVVQRYRNDAFDFVQQVAQDPASLEATSGLEALMTGVDLRGVEIANGDDDDF